MNRREFVERVGGPAVCGRSGIDRAGCARCGGCPTASGGGFAVSGHRHAHPHLRQDARRRHALPARHAGRRRTAAGLRRPAGPLQARRVTLRRRRRDHRRGEPAARGQLLVARRRQGQPDHRRAGGTDRSGGRGVSEESRPPRHRTSCSWASGRGSSSSGSTSRSTSPT